MFVFGRRLKELRKQANLTQQELGKLVGVTKVSICCYENGTRTPTLDTLKDLADSLNTPLTYLLATDTFAVSEDNKTSTINLAKEEIEILKELRMHPQLYEKLIDDPKRFIDYIDKKIR